MKTTCAADEKYLKFTAVDAFCVDWESGQEGLFSVA